MTSDADAWIVPDWPAPPGVGAVMSTRIGGRSAAPFDGFNLRDGIGDAPEAVRANQVVFAARCGGEPVWLSQVHGTTVARLTANVPAGPVHADAALTTLGGRVCAVQVADCLPVLLAARNARAVAAVHAGWRGLAAGVIEAAVAALVREAACPHGEVLAWLGPCIGPSAFEVGADVPLGFGLALAPGQQAEGFRPLPAAQSKWLGDLPALARQRLRAIGVLAVHGNDGSSRWCTASNPSRFFSFRRDGVTGRLAAGIWRGA